MGKDWMIAVGVAVVLLIAAALGDHETEDLAPLGYLLLAGSGAALVVRRRMPVAVLLVSGLCAVGYNAVGFEVPAVAYLFAVWAAVRLGHWVATLIVTIGVLAALPVAVMMSPEGSSTGEAFVQARGVLEIAWLVAAAAAGEALRQAEQRAEAAERTREEVARLRANEERLRIARELHDSLTHQISIVKVQAEVAVHLARKRGDEVPKALLAIQQAGREATRELRATLATLRDDANSTGHGLDQLEELLRRVEGMGVTTTLTVNERQPVPVVVDQTAYRIVQEALTNVARHAGVASAKVHIDYGPSVLTIRVDDDGKAMANAVVVPGLGMLGMRERVTALGGCLRAEPRDVGGFTVQAELPR